MNEQEIRQLIEDTIVQEVKSKLAGVDILSDRVFFQRDIELAAHSRLKTSIDSKIGLFGATVVGQQATTGTTTGFTAGGGTASKSDSTFTGDFGTTAYTVGDLVLALKKVGILLQ